MKQSVLFIGIAALFWGFTTLQAEVESVKPVDPQLIKEVSSSTAKKLAWINRFELKRDEASLLFTECSLISNEIDLTPNELIECIFSSDQWTPKDRIFVYTLHGGLINEKGVAEELTVDPSGRLIFSFKAGPYYGNLPLVIRYQGKEQLINFWVRPPSS